MFSPGWWPCSAAERSQEALLGLAPSAPTPGQGVGELLGPNARIAAAGLLETRFAGLGVAVKPNGDGKCGLSSLELGK